MWKIFRVDGPLFRILSILTDLLIANVLFVICSIPIITMGAAFAGLQKICMDKAMDDVEPVVKPFFKAFKSNFWEATISFVIYALCNVALLWYLTFVPQVMTGNQLGIVNTAAIILMVIVNGIWCYLLPLMVRYDNKLKEHFKNACVLSFANLPRTILMIIVNVIPITMLLLSVDYFVNTFVLWILVGFAFIRVTCCVIIKPVIKKLEPEDDLETDVEDEDETSLLL